MAIEIKSCGGKRRGMSLLIGRSDLVISLPALAPSLAMLLPTSTRALLLVSTRRVPYCHMPILASSYFFPLEDGTIVLFLAWGQYVYAPLEE
ncbi:hypothetical protein DAI22_02g277466 [Oryza sativa Japonica Group]|nr:hypothetical protein DAI22_02g277466 [Oryza sativa Japonica Group]